MKQELVEKVMRQMSDLENKADPFDNPYLAIARYALALAERAAREGRAAGRRMGLYDLVTTPEECVERVVEGGA